MTLGLLKCLLHTVMVHVLGSSFLPLVRLYIHIAEVWWLHDIEHIIIHDLFFWTQEESILGRFSFSTAVQWCLVMLNWMLKNTIFLFPARWC